MPSHVGSQLGSNFVNLSHEGLSGFLFTPIEPSFCQLFKFLSCTERRDKRSAYISQDKLDVVQEWERKKVAVIAILSYLGKSV
jgi:hypothetical protein